MADESLWFMHDSECCMKRITPQIRDEHVEYIKQIQMDADGDISDAEAVRRIFDGAMQHEAEVERLESELEQTEARAEELRSKLIATGEKVEASNELVRVVEEEQSLQTRRAEAGALTRAKWWLVGMPSKQPSDSE
jgi:archaellum component FlaC